MGFGDEDDHLHMETQRSLIADCIPVGTAASAAAVAAAAISVKDVLTTIMMIQLYM